MKRRHVVHPWEEGVSLRGHSDRVDQEVRQHELRHNGTGGHTRPGGPEQISDRVDLSPLALGDEESLECREALQVLCSRCDRGGGQRIRVACLN